MKSNNKHLKIFSMLPAVAGLLLLLILNSITLPNHLQNGIFCFLIGFSMIRLIYLSIWFTPNSFSKMAFQKQSGNIVNRIKINVKSDMPPYQGKTLVEIAGTVIMIIASLSLTTFVPFINSSLMYTLGKTVW